ncbi:DUF1769-domain-containing protein [Artomyces pyxidatus]|uniref:DUF1769-domain-containing protein n=1 Tax=Artomyces pyxidatus TaxID=48021 RepID=A0ACB8T6M7_9AGAM|nr:DUF1769-domain-containing protein [Artomyces pyxidatus]
MPRLRVVAGPSTSELVPITANSGVPHPIMSDAFEGKILAYIKGFTDEQGRVLESEYFDREDRKGITWSIQVQGRFLRPISADDVMFGNTFDRPLKLPWGSGAALKFMKFVDPTLDHDLASSTQPWALSPLISTMPHFAHTHTDSSRSSSPMTHLDPGHPSPSVSPNGAHSATLSSPSCPPFPSSRSLTDDTSQLHLALQCPSYSPEVGSLSPSPSHSSDGHGPPSTSPSRDPDTKRSKRLSTGSIASIASHLSTGSADRRARRRTGKANKKEERLRELGARGERRAYFRDAERRREIVFGPEDVLTVDFCYGFLEFAPTLALQLPGGISFDLMHYWDGQPVRFVCCERKRGAHAEGETPWGRVLWCVAIELAADEQESEVD